MTQSAEYRRLVRLAAGYNKRAAKFGRRGRITAVELWALENETWHCHYCGIELAFGQGSFDHVVAFDRGGENTYLNIARCCLTCQRQKFTKTPAEYEEHQDLIVSCSVCGKTFKPRWAEYQRGDARVCSRSCAGRRRWVSSSSERSTPAPDARAGRATKGTSP